MRLLFVDECGDSEKKDYLGLSIATVDGRFYPLLKRKTQAILLKGKWDPAIEFKGAVLFSSSKGCADVSVDDRIAMAGALLDLNASNQNSRMRFSYGRLLSGNHGADYLTHLPGLMNRILPMAPKGAGKDLLAITCDQRSDVDPRELHRVLAPVAEKKGYIIHEAVVCARSSFHTVGVMFADIVGYLAARIDTIATDAQLFEGLTPEQLAKDGKYLKLASSRTLISKVKKLSLLTQSGGRNHRNSRR
jgi:hypothetical protein